ncbi:TetR/AcrR family transcriptional regulator [Planctomonas sp. JC2975]|uniref:TetR/AcrR family transcriptional regulator n=1 Tax=Planctomonas sp. JC2975 TaxID=2729626 RepID=UPI0014733023|nr:TetR/AcrR family transcriptional regulator [Planctomonas sp. JC2975]NNC13888.1 TetR/AcrR family transcriptional regulator [Planctomonas sp. JC2975]
MPRPARPLSPEASERLRLAAAEAFGAKGLDDASLNDILKQADMGKGSFYHRFADKAALHDWVADAMARAVIEQSRPPGLSSLTAETFRAELSAMLGRFTSLAAERPELANLGLMFHNSAGLPEERAMTMVRAAVLRWIEDALLRGRELGVIRADLPADLLSALAIASLTTIDTWVLAAPSEPAARASTASAALDALWALLAPPAPSR